jgi:ATP-dependent RNA helicase UAP56/SUB2
MEQDQRFSIFNRFKDNEFRILVSTDLAGRGVDIVRVNLVINFDIPDSEEDYMHRIGRAGRFETQGMAISFSATNEDKNLLDNVNKNFTIKIKELPKELNTMKDD